MSGGWWHRASQAQKLAQLDAGIELGMAAAQIALASGASRPAVASFADYHHRIIPRSDHRNQFSSSRRARRKFSAKVAYERGEPVNFWSDDPRVHRATPDDDTAAEIVG